MKEMSKQELDLMSNRLIYNLSYIEKLHTIAQRGFKPNINTGDECFSEMYEGYKDSILEDLYRNLIKELGITLLEILVPRDEIMGIIEVNKKSPLTIALDLKNIILKYDSVGIDKKCPRNFDMLFKSIPMLLDSCYSSIDDLYNIVVYVLELNNDEE